MQYELREEGMQARRERLTETVGSMRGYRSGYLNSRETTRVADDESHRGWKVPRRQRCACEGQGDAARAGEATARARRWRGDAAHEREE